jgi:hypothetical protein
MDSVLLGKSWTAYERENTMILRTVGSYSPAAQHHIPEGFNHLHKFYCAYAQHTAVTMALHAHCSEYTVSGIQCPLVYMQQQWHYVPTAVNMMATSHKYFIQCADSNSLVYHET